MLKNEAPRGGTGPPLAPGEGRTRVRLIVFEIDTLTV